MKITIILFTLLLPAMVFPAPPSTRENATFFNGKGDTAAGNTITADTAARDTAWLERARRMEAEAIRQTRPWRERLRGGRTVADLPRENPPAGMAMLAVKANIPAWAAGVMNIALEARVARRWTVELPVTWSPWHIARQHAARVLALQPEARFWRRAPGEGWFAGVHAHAAWFNARWKEDRYQSTGRPLLGAGVSLGYALPLGGRWGAEFSAGAGYASIKYNTYYNIPNGARISTRSRDYWGITRARIAVTWKLKI